MVQTNSESELNLFSLLIMTWGLVEILRIQNKILSSISFIVKESQQAK